MIRVLVVLAALAAAAPAAAQPIAPAPYTVLQDARDGERFAAEQAARQRDIALTNELSRLQAQAQTNQGLVDLQAMRTGPAAPSFTPGPNGAPPRLDTRKLVQIPDAELADSNAKVRAASQNRH